MAGRSEKTVMVLLGHYRPLKRNLNNFKYQEPDWEQTIQVTFHIHSLPFEKYNIEIYRIDAKHSNLMKDFQKRGNVGDLDPPEIIEGSELNLTHSLEVPAYGVCALRFVEKE